MQEFTYPEDLSDKQLYDTVKTVLNRRGYKDKNEGSEAIYRAEAVKVENKKETLKIFGPSSSEEEIIAKLLEPELE